MIRVRLKLKLTCRQERQLEEWLWILTGVYNWTLRKIELDAADRIYHRFYALKDLIAGHSKRLGVPSHVLQATIKTAHNSWDRHFRRLAGKPRLKGHRNKLNSIPFPDPRFRLWPNTRISILGVGRVRFHKQDLPDGIIKSGRVVKRASGWYLCLLIDAEAKAIARCGYEQVGIDPGFKNLLTLSNGERIAHPRELETAQSRLAQAQRGGNQRLSALLYERITNQRKDRNHKLSRRLVSENELIAFSADNHRAISRKFGKSVASSAHGQLRSMLAYKSRLGGTLYVEPDSKKSTMTCSTCGAESGPRGLAGLKVREWDCGECGSHHDRDINAARNALIAGIGAIHEGLAKVA